MKTVVLAAGYATRLYPLTENKPKALLPIGSKLLIDHLAQKIAGIIEPNQTIIVTNDRFYGAFDDWALVGAFKRAVVLNDRTTSNDDRLGAIGDFQFAIDKLRLDDDVLMLASDNLFDGSLGEFVRFARSKNGAPCVGVTDLGDPMKGSKRYGMIKLDGTGRITAIDEKPEKPQTPYASMGVYYFPRASLHLVREYLSSAQKNDAPGHYVTWLLNKTSVYGFVFKGQWYDIGSIDQLNEAGREYERVRAH